MNPICVAVPDVVRDLAMRPFTILIGTLLLLGLAAEPAHAQKRMALVIGNAHYRHMTILTNPERDARAVVINDRCLAVDGRYYFLPQNFRYKSQPCSHRFL